MVAKMDDMCVFYKEDIQIAIEAIKDSLLYPDSEIIYDLYAIPSHNHQAFYAAIYKNKNEYEMVYARSEIYNMVFDKPIRMYPFTSAIKAKSKSNYDGRIIIGISKLSNDFAKNISDVAAKVPEGCYNNELLTLDGVFQVIRVFTDGITKEIIYTDADRIPNIDDFPDMKDFLNDMYLFVEEMII